MIREQIKQLGEHIGDMRSIDAMVLTNGNGFVTCCVYAVKKRFLINKTVVSFSTKCGFDLWEEREGSREHSLKVLGKKIPITDEEGLYLGAKYLNKTESGEQSLKYATKGLEALAQELLKMEELA